MNKKFRPALTVILLLALTACDFKPFPAPKASTARTLSLTLSNLQVASSGNLEGDITIENRAQEAMWVYTGITQGKNPSFFYPTQFLLYARDDEHTYLLTTPPPSVVADIIKKKTTMELLPHASQTVHVTWGFEAWPLPLKSVAPGQSGIDLQPGSYEFYAQYNGTAAEADCTLCWAGKVKSNKVDFTVP